MRVGEGWGGERGAKRGGMVWGEGWEEEMLINVALGRMEVLERKKFNFNRSFLVTSAKQNRKKVYTISTFFLSFSIHFEQVNNINFVKKINWNQV